LTFRRRILADVFGSLYKSGIEEYPQKHQKEVVEGLKEAYGNEQDSRILPMT